jgi:polyisoprenyl-teichoic acid--peptidoglycan teichoic acid transferase
LPEDYTRPPSLWRRYLPGALLIVVVAATSTAVAAFREVNKVVSAFNAGEQLDLGSDLATADAGRPQTIMLIGSDRRGKRVKTTGRRNRGYGARSDTIILVRLDPSKKATALLSLPRDLKVRIPGHGTNKINAAYSEGGPRLTLRTVKELTGLRINHVINVDFHGFQKAVNTIGCVYLDIDRRYFNLNTGGVSNYASIDIKPGYQKLCGEDALSYVRYRHEDNDLVRSARQQDFIRQAKQQVGVGKLVEDRDELIKIFGRYTSSDIRSRSAVIRLLKLVVRSAAHPIREVHFEGSLGASYVTASNVKVKKLAQQFLGVEATKGPRGELRPKGRRRGSRRGDLNLEDATAVGRDQALQAIAERVKIPVFYPRMRTRGARFIGPPRVYTINSRGHNWSSYRMIIKRPLVGEYYGLQGTQWPKAPILENPSEKRKIGGREYELHFDGDRLRLVAWRTDEGAYWVSNTLLQTLTNKQMLAIARSARTL